MVDRAAQAEYARRGISLIDPEEGALSLLRELAWGDESLRSVVLHRVGLVSHAAASSVTRRHRRDVGAAARRARPGHVLAQPGAGVDAITEVAGGPAGPGVLRPRSARTGCTAAAAASSTTSRSWTSTRFGMMPSLGVGQRARPADRAAGRGSRGRRRGRPDRLPRPGPGRRRPRPRRLPHARHGRLDQPGPHRPAARADTARAAARARRGPAAGRCGRRSATQTGPVRPESAIGLVPNLAASRIANRLDLRGPAYTVDAACASSLVAVDQAVQRAGHRALRRDARRRRAPLPRHHAVDRLHPARGAEPQPADPAVRPRRRRPADRRGHRCRRAQAARRRRTRRRPGLRGDPRHAASPATAGRGSLVNPEPDGQELAVAPGLGGGRTRPAEPDSLGLLEAHGTATPTGDAAELDHDRAGLRPGR